MKKIVVLLLIISVFLTACENKNNAETTASNLPQADASCTHEDADGNGLCDNCKGAVTVTVDFYAINDLHGKFGDTDANIGVDELTSYIKNSGKADDNYVVLSSGDMWQGGSESNLTKGNIITEWMNDLDVASMTLGNHEFDWGIEYIVENAEIAEFPFLAINIYDKSTNQLADFCTPSVIVDRGGIQIGIIGAIGDCYSSISSDKTEGIYFKTDAALTSLVKVESEKLRNAGADYIVYSLHDGYGRSKNGVSSIDGNMISSYYDIELSKNGYVDIVFEGHTHKNYVLKDTYGVYHLQSGGDNEGIAHAEVTVNFVTSENTVNTVEYVSSDRYASMQDDPIVKKLLEKYAEEISQGSLSIGTNDIKRESDFLCQTVADLYYKKGIERWGSRYDIVLGGGFISARSPYYLASGEVTYAMVQAVFPFDNPLVLCTVSGKDLKNKFLQTSNKNYFVSYESTLASRIDDSETYFIVVDTYTSTYAPNNLTEVEMYNPNIFARDILADYIAAGGFTDSGKTYQKLSIPEITVIGNALADNAQTEEKYITKGKITQIHNSKYGNMTIEDEDKNTLYIYGLYDALGERYDKMANPPQIGDVITVCAHIKKFVDKNTSPALVELVNAKLYE